MFGETAPAQKFLDTWPVEKFFYPRNGLKENDP